MKQDGELNISGMFVSVSYDKGIVFKTDIRYAH